MENVFLTHIWGLGASVRGGRGHMAYEISHFFFLPFAIA